MVNKHRVRACLNVPCLSKSDRQLKHVFQLLCTVKNPKGSSYDSEIKKTLSLQVLGLVSNLFETFIFN